eukprot:TRINITY_DN3160_c3_g2_i5.p1 TRINITY_DN3160_c3_g2~~TRINITY_DN3160_c3_g2_i5.p1  ORF type:complete len:113 (+),score=27.31 TRINITY_DN3160_c3_g2_i5:37-339(+)
MSDPFAEIGVFGCLGDIPTTIKACILPGMVNAETLAKMEDNRECSICDCLTGGAEGYRIRKRIRHEKGGKKYDDLMDLVCVGCCSICVTVQNARVVQKMY